MIVAFRVATSGRYEASKPLREPRRLAWIRSLPCEVCGRTWRVEAAHTGPHGIGQKAGDDTAIPLCARDHRTGPHSLHKLGPVKFQEYWKIDIAASRKRLREEWDGMQERRAA